MGQRVEGRELLSIGAGLRKIVRPFYKEESGQPPAEKP